MQFIYKNFLVQIILNLDANLIMAICKGNNPSKFKTGIKSGKIIKTIAYKDMNSINFTINIPIDPNEKDFSFYSAEEYLSSNSIMKRVCKEINKQKV